HPIYKLGGKAGPARTPGGEASSRSRATCNQEGGTSALKGEIAEGIGAGRVNSAFFALPASTNRIGGVRLMKFFFLVFSLLVIAYGIARAQSPSERNPDVSNKALITKSTPTMTADAF